MHILLLKPKALYVISRFAQACARAGVDLTVLMASKPPTRQYLVSFENEAMQTIEALDVDDENVEAMAAALGRYDAVVAGGEYTAIFGERLAARLGVFHNPLEPAASYRDKHQMRQRFAEAGVSQPRLLARFANMHEVQAHDWAAVRFPVIVKPVDMSSSFYVRRCEDAESARKVYRRIFMHSQSFAGVGFSAQGLLEELAPGPEYSAECVVEDGQLRAIFLTSKLLSAYPSCDEVGHLSGEPWASAAMQAQARAAAEGVVRAWQLHSGVMHLEFKWHDGELKVIEAACRVAGDMISVLVEMRYGVSLEECLVRLRCRGQLALALGRHTPQGDGHCYGIKYLFHENIGTVPGPGIEVLESVRFAKEDTGAAGYGVESRLGYKLVRSRSHALLKRYVGALIAADATCAAAETLEVTT